MGTFRLSTDFINYTVSSVTSQSGGFIANNLKDRAHPKRAWRSTSLSAQEIVIDLLSQRLNPEVHVEVANFTQIQFIGSNDGTTWNGFDTGVLTIPYDPKQGVYRYGNKITGFNHRYVKVLIPNQAVVNGASYFSLGTLSFLGTTNTLVRNPRQGLAYAENSRDGFLVNEFDSGGVEVYDLTALRPISFELSLRQPFKNGSSTLIWDTFRSKATIVYIHFGLGDNWQAYLVRRVGRLREVRDFYSALTFDTFEVALVV